MRHKRTAAVLRDLIRSPDPQVACILMGCKRIWLIVLGVCGVGNFSAAAPVDRMDDVSFWVGQGANRSAFVVDWDANNEHDFSMVWGYRWEGQATADDMLQAIVRADNRLYAKIGSFGDQIVVFGVGYDASGDGLFSLDDGTVFDADGIAMSAASDLGASIDSDDFYREGWLLGYWYHAVALNANEQPGPWGGGPGLSGQALVDGDWTSLVYKNSTDAVLAYPGSLVTSQDTSVIGDYVRDGRVDAADFTRWRDTLGDLVMLPGYGADGDFDGTVGVADWQIWADGFGSAASVPGGQASGPSAADRAVVPEPGVQGMLAWMLLSFFWFSGKCNR